MQAAILLDAPEVGAANGGAPSYPPKFGKPGGSVIVVSAGGSTGGSTGGATAGAVVGGGVLGGGGAASGAQMATLIGVPSSTAPLAD